MLIDSHVNLHAPQFDEDREAVIARALGSLPVKDLTVENAPLEEVMSEVFARGREARESAAAAKVTGS